MSTNGSPEFPQQPTPGQPPYGAQYPGQYPGQPYPGQAYPGQPNPGWDPNQQYHQNTPYLQQPVQQQYFSQPGAAPVVYMVQATSLKGLRGWLMFFVIWAGLSALTTGAQLSWIFSSDGNATDKLMIPLLVVASLAAVITAAMELRLATWVFMAWAGLWFVYNVASASNASSNMPFYGGEALTMTIITTGMFTGFVILYFLVSKRVKETLVK